MNKSSQRIKQRREELGISQEELAARIGLTQTQVSRYELGDSDPKASALAAIARALMVTTDWLVGLDDREVDALSPDEKQALEVYRAVPPDRQANVLEIMRLAS